MLEKAASSATGRAALAGIIVVVILMPVGYSAFARVAFSGVEAPEKPVGKGTRCLSENPFDEDAKHMQTAEYMRFHHWELLRGLREEVVRDGVRGDISLDGCWNCHQSKVRFCDRCHDAASVRPDCFGCHYYPDLDEKLLER